MLPNKFHSIDKSILSKLIPLMEQKSTEPISIKTLAKKNKKYFKDTAELILALDILFILGVIEIDPTTKDIHYVN